MCAKRKNQGNLRCPGCKNLVGSVDAFIVHYNTQHQGRVLGELEGYRVGLQQCDTCHKLVRRSSGQWSSHVKRCTAAASSMAGGHTCILSECKTRMGDTPGEVAIHWRRHHLNRNARGHAEELDREGCAPC